MRPAILVHRGPEPVRNRPSIEIYGEFAGEYLGWALCVAHTDSTVRGGPLLAWAVGPLDHTIVTHRDKVLTAASVALLVDKIDKLEGLT